MSQAVQPVSVQCPYCGEAFETALDTPEPGMRFIEDCPVCCRPVEFSLRLDPDGFTVTVRREDD